MKRIIVPIILSVLIAVTCAKKEEGALEKGTPAYELAEELATKLPSLNPDLNKVIVSTTEFKITTGEVIQSIYKRSQNRAMRLKDMDSEKLKEFFKGNAKRMAEEKLLLAAAEKANVAATKSEVDSILNTLYSRFGSKEKYEERLKENGSSLELAEKNINNHFTIQKYLDKILNEQTVVSEEEIQQAYQADKTATVRHILLLTQGKSESEKQEIRKKMEEILAKAKKGEDFAELVKKYSEDPGSKDVGGLYQDFERGRMVKPFEDAAFSIPIGEISDIVETRYGYHILKVVDRKKETRPLKEVRADLELKLKGDKKIQVYQEFMAQIKKDAGFEIQEL